MLANKIVLRLDVRLALVFIEILKELKAEQVGVDPQPEQFAFDVPSVIVRVARNRVTPESLGKRANRSASSRLAASASRFKSSCTGASTRSGLKQGHKLQRKTECAADQNRAIQLVGTCSR
jgi:hypothetical protein